MTVVEISEEDGKRAEFLMKAITILNQVFEDSETMRVDANLLVDERQELAWSVNRRRSREALMALHDFCRCGIEANVDQRVLINVAAHASQFRRKKE